MRDSLAARLVSWVAARLAGEAELVLPLPTTAWASPSFFTAWASAVTARSAAFCVEMERLAPPLASRVLSAVESVVES